MPDALPNGKPKPWIETFVPIFGWGLLAGAFAATIWFQSARDAIQRHSEQIGEIYRRLGAMDDNDKRIESEIQDARVERYSQLDQVKNIIAGNTERLTALQHEVVGHDENHEHRIEELEKRCGVQAHP